MRIGILGAGSMAEALGGHWRRAGHELMVSGRDRGKAALVAERLGGLAGSFHEAAGFGEVTLLAVRAEGVFDVLAAAGAGSGTLAGRALIDCTNPVVPGRFTLSTDGGPSMAQRVAEYATGSLVVKGFNLAHDGVWRMRPPAFDGVPLSVPLCGDDADALELAAGLVSDVGCVPVVTGGLERAALLEATAAFVIGLLFAGEDPRAALPPFEFAVR
ncbi:NADPH-dependent F420 reductase [Flindersiella endophytica]